MVRLYDKEKNVKMCCRADRVWATKYVEPLVGLYEFVAPIRYVLRLFIITNFVLFWRLFFRFGLVKIRHLTAEMITNKNDYYK
jgi:hypothetical protein